MIYSIVGANLNLKMKIATCVAAIASLCFINATNADIFVEIDDVVTTAGSNVSVNVSASATAGEDLISIDNPLDFGIVGPGSLTGFSFLGATAVESFDSFTPGLNPSSAEDHLQSAINFVTPIGLSSTPTVLYTLDFAVDSSVSDGTVFDIQILDDGTFDGNPTSFLVFDGNFAAVDAVAINGSITISGVPEPVSTTLVLFVGISFATFRLRS